MGKPKSKELMANPVALPLRRIAIVGTIAVLAGAWKSKPLLQSIFTGPGSWSRIAFLAIALLNYKNFPLVWHVRVWNSILHHFFARHTFDKDGELAGLNDSRHLPAVFRPSVTPGRSPITEIDYNLHKSNSTYFTDLDAARGHCVCALTHVAISKLQRNPGLIIAPDGKPATGKWQSFMGGVMCSFKREIKPYEGYDMWTRLLCWDRKWFYIVTHFVPKGSVAPVGWTLDPPSNFGVLPSFLNPKKGGKNGTGTGFPDATVDMSEVDRSKIFASAISKYVMKVGRLTIHPEAILSLSNLLPPRQGGWNTMSGPSSEVQTPEEGEVDEQTTMLGDSVFTHIPVAHGAVGSENGGVKEAVAENDAGWTWQMIEAENEKGLKLANNFAELDGLPEAFTGNSAPALGYYPDLF